MLNDLVLKLHPLFPKGTWRRRNAGRLLRAIRSLDQRAKASLSGLTYRHLHEKLFPVPEAAQWYAENIPSPEQLQQQRRRKWPADAPQIALLLPITRVNHSHLATTLRSLEEQTSRHGELLLIAPSRIADRCRKIQESALKSFAARWIVVPDGADPITMLEQARHQTDCDYVGVMDVGDVLAPHALHDMADHILREKLPDVIYCDESRCSKPGGAPDSLVLKPEFSPERLLGQNYVGRLSLIRSSTLSASGGFDSRFGGAQEYDAFLRLSERETHWVRLPQCLYHRPARSRKLTKQRNGSATAALEAGAVREHLRRRGFEASAIPQENGHCRVTWPLPRKPLVSVIIPTVNNLEVLQTCIDGLLKKTDYSELEIILVDTESTDVEVLQYYEKLTANQSIRVVSYTRPFNYSEACNIGAKAAIGEILLFLNNDIEVLTRDWLTEMVRFCQLPGVGCVGTKLLYPDGKVQHAAVVIGVHLCGLLYNGVSEEHRDLFGSPNEYRNVSAIMGACQMIPRRVFDAVGGFDERYEIANSDVAICLRIIQAGQRVVYTPYAALCHHEGCTRGKTNPSADLEITALDLREMGWKSDPYFHPALCPHDSTPRLTRKPEVSQREFLALQVRDLCARSHSRLAPLDLFQRERFLEYLAGNALDLAYPVWDPADGLATEEAAACFAVHCLQTSEELRQRFPTALSDGPDGEYCQWLCTTGLRQYDLPATAAELIITVFKKSPGAYVRRVFDFRNDLQEVFPLALLPSGRRDFLRWMVKHGMAECGLRNDQIWWFLLETAEDPVRELITTYRLTPGWQSRFPDALSAVGWPKFLGWVIRHYRLEDDGLECTEPEFPLTPLEQLRCSWNRRPQWRILHRDAFQNRAGLKGLVSSLESQAQTDGHPDTHWLAKLRLAAADTSEPRLGMNILGHFRYPSGLQVSVQSIVKSLKLRNIATSCRDVPADLSSDEPNRTDYLGQEIYPTTLIHVQPEPFFENAFARAGLAPARDRYRIGMWYWEFGTVPRDWDRLSDTVQELWAPTKFIADALKSVMSVPVHPMLPGVQLGAVKPVSRARFGIPQDTFLFLFAYDMASIQERKNPLGLIKAFQTAFRRDDRVALAIKVSRGSRDPKEFAKLQDAAHQAGVIIIDEILPRDEVNGLLDACDCYVSLHRSEGLGLTMAEAMLLGKPVISTGYSGNLDFMSETNSRLVSHRLIPLGKEIPPYKRDYLWADPNLAEAAHWMRWMYEHPEEARALGAKARLQVEQTLSLEASADRLVKRLREIELLRTETEFRIEPQCQPLARAA